MIVIKKTEKSEEVEPNPLLVEYFQKMNEVMTSPEEGFMKDIHFPYILSNIEQNIFLLKRLKERNLLREENNIIDCGIGLGFCLYDFYLQSKELDLKFKFFGVEKYKSYLDCLNKNLIHYWNSELNLFNSDILEHGFSDYNIVYTYGPFRSEKKQKELMEKISSEISSGSIIIENANSGKGHFDLLSKIDSLQELEIDDIYIYIKK
jgi:hypothetical protein